LETGRMIHHGFSLSLYVMEFSGPCLRLLGLFSDLLA
jgi:hypothetical protein